MGCPTCGNKEEGGGLKVILAGKGRERVQTLAFMFGITAAVVSAVSGAYLLTADRIRLNETLYLKRAVIGAAGLPAPAAAAAVEALYAARVRTTPESDRFEILAGAGRPAGGVVLRQAGVGLWGPIRAVVGFDAADGRLTGIAFLEQSETPGLGARIEEPWFKAQFKGKKGPFELVPEGAPDKDDEFDAITGATITAKGVRDLVNACVKRQAADRQPPKEGEGP